MKICIISADYYKNISKNLLIGVCAELDRHNKTNKKNKLKYEKIIVPGVFEIPFIISSNIRKFNAFIALGCVIKGETPHFDFMSTAVIKSILDITIQHKKPITNGIITCLNKEQAQVRADIDKKNKGGEAAKALIKLLEITSRK
jgi:6,7-dimethyl-8-ribityllumazine synthase